YGQLELPDGNVLTNEGHIIGNNKSTTATFPINGPFLLSLYRTNDSLIWYSKETSNPGVNRLYCYNERSGTLKSFDKLFIAGLNALTYANKRIYISHAAGLGYIEADTIHYVFDKNHWKLLAFDMMEVEPGKLFIATCNGLLQLNLNSEKLDT